MDSSNYSSQMHDDSFGSKGTDRRQKSRNNLIPLSTSDRSSFTSNDAGTSQLTRRKLLRDDDNMVYDDESSSLDSSSSEDGSNEEDEPSPQAVFKHQITLKKYR